MKTCVVATALLIGALSPARVSAQNRVSVELGGLISAYDVPSGPAVARGAIRVPDSTGTGGNAVSSGGADTSAQGLAAFEVRPTVTLENGFLMGVGFRVGQAGLGEVGASLFGADVALGFQHRFGHFMPFVAACSASTATRSRTRTWASRRTSDSTP